MKATDENRGRIRGTVEKCLRGVLPPETPLPGYDDDWIDRGLLDSMAHVDVLLAIASALNVPKLFGQSGGALPTTLRAVVETICSALSASAATEIPKSWLVTSNEGASTGFAGWGSALGSDRVSILEVEQDFQLSNAVLAKNAGIDSVCRASAIEDEVVLGKRAAQQALHRARVSVQNLDWIIATSETFLGFPSFAASLHATLLASATCQVLDIGGACIGLLNGLTVASALCTNPRVQCVLIVSSDMHSRILSAAKVPGKFGGLFGDGASAFLLQRRSQDLDQQPYVISGSLGGCAGAFSSLLRIRPGKDASICLEFDGKGLARAAVDRMERMITDVEKACGVDRAAFSAFALHQPNPRLLDTLITRTSLPADKVPLVAKYCGNLGSSTCGVALSMALDIHGTKLRNARGPILAASLGPGMVWTGLVLG
ncbi:MAG TPA: 3-oxoacyl-[acyl-carrier-protein] synthase III C-terminal domain-containing protein [Candidatus Acidoferrum sp.]|nr:3-oxoacyl-[acyl-carrier-protein] synthase III C-terminal domain-containing protein [Candidatus Acidoferrum sp.]